MDSWKNHTSKMSCCTVPFTMKNIVNEQWLLVLTPSQTSPAHLIGNTTNVFTNFKLFKVKVSKDLIFRNTVHST